LSRETSDGVVLPFTIGSATGPLKLIEPKSAPSDAGGKPSEACSGPEFHVGSISVSMGA